MKSAIFLVLLLVAAATAFPDCGLKGTGTEQKIGDALKGEFPWMVAIRENNKPLCGGTLIGNQYVLTAAHCFRTGNKDDYLVRVGDLNRLDDDGTERDFSIAELHVHEDFGSPYKKAYPHYFHFNNDIALVKLSKPVDFSGPSAGPACLPPAGKDYQSIWKCIMTGWGLTNPGDHKSFANNLQKITSYTLKNRWLELQYYAYGPLPDHALGFGSSKGACFGDAGGPLVCPNGSGTYDLAGIVSYGPRACKGVAGVFTEVAAYREWISKVSGGAI